MIEIRRECYESEKRKEGLGGARWEIIEKKKINIILIKNMCIIDKLMLVFCKNDGVK